MTHLQLFSLTLQTTTNPSPEADKLSGMPSVWTIRLQTYPPPVPRQGADTRPSLSGPQTHRHRHARARLISMFIEFFAEDRKLGRDKNTSGPASQTRQQPPPSKRAEASINPTTPPYVTARGCDGVHCNMQ